MTSKNGQKLVDALASVDWSRNASAFCGDVDAVDKLARLNFRLAVWARQLEIVDKANPALCFVREMQVAGHVLVMSTALCIYKSAAASARTVLENALYYTYFRSHPSELATLVRDERWFISKPQIVDYLSIHSPRFADAQKKLPVIGPMNAWYSRISAVIHGQVPGAWTTQKSISDTKPNASIQATVIDNFTECVDIVNRLFLCTVGLEFWDYFSIQAKSELIHGLSGEVKTALGLDAA